MTAESIAPETETPEVSPAHRRAAETEYAILNALLTQTTAAHFQQRCLVLSAENEALRTAVAGLKGHVIALQQLVVGEPDSAVGEQDSTQAPEGVQPAD